MTTQSLRFSRLRSLTVAALGLVVSVPIFAAASAPDETQRERLARIRVPFVENCGQWDQRVAFAARANFGTVFVTRKGQLVYSLGNGAAGGWTLTETTISGKPVPGSGQPAVTRVSYFHGDDPGRWHSGLPSYEEISLGEVWRGISMSLRARGTTVEKIFTVAPGAKAERIRLRVDGARSLRIASDGSLVATTGDGQVRFTTPKAYQERGGTHQPIKVAYVVHGSRYGFRLGNYDPSLPVVIDPLLQSTYLGGSSWEGIGAITLGSSTGELFVAGSTSSTDFPGATGGAQSTLGGSSDAFVAKLDTTLTTLLQATYLGGGDGDLGYAIAVDPTTGQVLVAGSTSSADFPGTAGGAQPTPGGGPEDGFVARLDPALTTLLQATYLGGSGVSFERVNAIAVHPSNADVLVAGSTSSTDFPGVAGGAQSTPGGSDDAFVARLDSALTDLLQATYLGGDSHDGMLAVSLAVDPSTGEVFVAGDTWSADFPGTAGGVQPSLSGFEDCFVARLDPALTTILQATHLGGSVDAVPFSIAIHAVAGELLIAGYTDSTDFPGTAGGAQSSLDFPSDAFVARLDITLTALLQATYLGGHGFDPARAVAADSSTGDVLVAGLTSSTNFPGTATGAQPAFGDGESDVFVARLNPTLTALLHATYLGGSSGEDSAGEIAIDPTTGEVLVTGFTYSTDFPGTAGGAQSESGGGVQDGFVARLTPDLAALLAPVGLTVDPLPTPGDGDFVFEPGETVPVIPSWENLSGSPQTPNGQASAFTGPAGATYTTLNGAVSYGTIPPGSVGIPAGAYSMSISLPDTRPATHWDAQFTETLDVQYVLPYRHILHVGDSFPDVPRSNIFYAFIENVLHHGITAGCGAGNYCPDSSVTRAQMAVFLLKGKHGSGYVPLPCTGIFGDVTCPGTFTDWIEQLFHEGVTGGCGGGNYCPDNPVTRAQMAAFLLKAEHGSSYTPPGCTGVFADVTCPSLFADWIEQLAAEQITGGCGGGNYCPTNPNTRGQMAVFLVKTFGLALYGP